MKNTNFNFIFGSEPTSEPTIQDEYILAKTERDRNWDTANFSACARYCGVSPPHISLIMCGKRAPSLAVAKRMSEFFNFSLDELFTELEKIHRRERGAGDTRPRRPSC